MNALAALSALQASPASNPLATRAMLSGLRIQQWSARKLDRKATAETNARANASADAGRFNKALLSADALGKIVTAANAARTAHYERTLPWLDDGARILPAAAYQAYSESMRRIRHDFEGAVEDFISGYPTFVEASRVRLGDMFDPNDYPPVSEIRARFTFNVRILPMPDAADFRVDLAASQADEIRAEIQASQTAALDLAMGDAWRRITETVGKMAERLQAYRPATAVSKAENAFRDSLVENVRDLVGILPAFNLTADPVLSDFIARMERDLCGANAERLRTDEAARNETAAAAAAILADVSAYLA
jgi:hypothetical protein